MRSLLFMATLLIALIASADSALAAGNLPAKPGGNTSKPAVVEEPPPLPEEEPTEYADDSSSSCETSATMEAMEVSCVSCAIQKTTGLVPSEKWLTLVALTSQQYYSEQDFGSSRAQRKDLADQFKNNFYRHISEKIQAYGFCLNNKITPEGRPTDVVGYGGIKDMPPELRQDLASLVRGRTIVDNSSQLKEYAKEFGFGGAEEMRDLFKVEGWQHETSRKREAIFNRRTVGMAMRGDKKGEALDGCIQQIKRLKDRFSYMQTGSQNNIRLCRSIANECGLQGTTFCTQPEPREPRSSGGGTGTKAPSIFDSPGRK